MMKLFCGSEAEHVPGVQNRRSEPSACSLRYTSLRAIQLEGVLFEQSLWIKLRNLMNWECRIDHTLHKQVALTKKTKIENSVSP